MVDDDDDDDDPTLSEINLSARAARRNEGKHFFLFESKERFFSRSVACCGVTPFLKFEV
jgi:hypothetical protein